MATDLLGLSARFIDEGIYEGPGSVNRPTGELSEVADGIAVVEAFSHVIALRTGDGLVLADTSLGAFGPVVRDALRGWADERVNTIVYTHGHVDHVGGARAFVDEAASRGEPAPHVVGHENVPARFDRYDLTNGYNGVVNQRQFGRRGRLGMGGATPSWPRDWVQPDTVFREQLQLEVGGTTIQLHHAKGETDDHAWGWLPSPRAILSGDFLTWVFPNAGNPQKVQRYPREWAVALRTMASFEPELLLPAHGLPIAGRERIAGVLDDVASALESLLDQTLELMNRGARLDEIVHTVRVPDDLLAKPYLRPTYDEPEFVVRNIWRMYGGWYDGNPSHLKPPPERELATEIASMAGGPHALADRADALAETNPHLAAQLVELAVQAAPDDPRVHSTRALVYGTLRERELSLMSKGIYRAAEDESADRALHQGPGAAR